jgi:hypothetical protein
MAARNHWPIKKVTADRWSIFTVESISTAYVTGAVGLATLALLILTLDKFCKKLLT